MEQGAAGLKALPAATVAPADFLYTEPSAQ
jgi:hypothetical protein